MKLNYSDKLRKGFNKTLFFFLFILPVYTFSQNCTINSNADKITCPGGDLGLPPDQFYLLGTANVTPGSDFLLKPVWSQISGPAVQIVNPNVLQTLVKGAIPGNTYVFRLTAQCGDSSTIFDDVSMTVLPITMANAGLDKSYCRGTYNLSANAVGASEVGKWTVIGNNNAGITLNDSNSPNTSFTVSGNSTGSTTFRWTIKNPSSNCETTDDVVITTLGGIEPVTAGADITLSNCYSSTQAVNLNGSFGGRTPGQQQGIWTVVSGPSIPSFANANDNNTNVSGLIQGTYVLRWTVAGTCANGVDEVTVIVPPPTADVTNVTGGKLYFCDGRTSTVLKGTTPLYVGETVQWTQTGGPTAVIQSPTSPSTLVSGLNAFGTYTFLYTLTNSTTNCVRTGTYTVTLEETMSISGGSNQELSCGVFSATMPITSVGNGQIKWQIVDGPINPFYPTYPTALINFSGSSLTIDNLVVSGNYIVRLLKVPVTESQCETVSDNILIISSAQPVNSNAGTTQVLPCNATSATLAGNIPTRGRGKWSQVSGPTTVTFTDASQSTTAVSPLVNGRYKFRWTISGGLACNDTQSTSEVVVSSAMPTAAQAGNDQSVCFGAPVQLQGNATMTSENGTWTVSPTAGITFSDVNDPNSKAFGLAQNTVYAFTWTIANGCGSSSDTVNVTTNNTQGANADAGVDQCLGTGSTSVMLTANDPSPGNGLWVQTAGATGTIVSPTQFNTAVTGLSDGNYEFKWTVTNVGCSDASDTVAITIAPAITIAQAGNDQNLCTNSATVTGNTPATGETGLWELVSGGDGPVITNPTSPTTTIINLTAGGWVYKWTISRGVCAASSDSVQLNVDEPPSTAVAGPDQILCNQTSTILAATTPAVGRSLWTLISGPNSPVFSNTRSATSTLSGLITGEYVLEWLNYNGINCPISRDLMTVKVTQAAAAGSDFSTCLEGALFLKGNDGSTGTWSYVSGGSSVPIITTTGSNTAAVTGLLPGVYVFRYTIAAAGSCPETSDDISVTINGQITGEVNAGSDQKLCVTTSTTIQLAATSADAGSTGKWTVLSGPSGGAFDNPALPNAKYLNPDFGIYVFNWTVSSGTCSKSDQVRVEYSDAPSAAIAGGDNTICGSIANLTAIPPLVGIGKWAQVSGPTAAIFSSEILPMTTVSNLTQTGGVYVFSWTVSNGTICTPTTDTVQITVTADLTTPNAGSDQTICQSSSATLAANVITIGTGKWQKISGPAGESFSNITDPNATFTPGGSGTYVLRWISTSINGLCQFFDEMTLVVDPSPTVANAGVPISICEFQALNLAANPPTIGTGFWTQVSGPSNVVFESPTSPTTVVFGAQAGIYIFQWKITSGSCPPSSSNVTVTINALPPLADAGIDQTICNTTTATLNGNNPSVGTGTWTFVANVGNTALITNPNLFNTTVTNISVGITRLKWTISNGSCTPYSDEVNIERASDLSISSLANDTTICQGGTVTLITAPTGSIAPYTYQWQSSSNGISGWTDISGQTSASYVTNASLTSGEYYYRVNVASSCAQMTSNIAKVTIISDPVVTSQPIGNTICSGATHIMTVAGTTTNNAAGPIAYQWQSSTNGTSGWANVSGGTGANTDTYTTAALTSNLYFRVRITQSGSGCETFSNPTLVNVTTITAQPTNPAAICMGGFVNVSISASLNGGSGTLSYQWQSDSGSGFVNETNPTATTASFVSDVLNSTTQFRCLITSSTTNCVLTSNTVTASVVQDPSISAQPVGGIVCSGGVITLSVAATGGTPTLNYQWYSSSDNVSFALISGATSNTYATPVLTSDTYYRVDVSATGNGCGLVSSNTVLVDVIPDPVITQQPVENTICSGGTHRLTVVASGDPLGGALSYQWQRSINGITGWVNTTGGTGATTASYTTGPLTSNFYYRVRIRQVPNGCEVFSVPVMVFVTTIITQPVTPPVICVGGTVSIDIRASLNGGTGSLSYQWQSDSGSGYVNETNASAATASFISDDLTKTTKFRCLVTSLTTGCILTSNEVIATVVPDPTITVQPTGITICSGGNHSLSVTATNGTPSLTYQWFSSINNTIFTAINGATSANYVTPALTQTTYYRVNVSASGSGCTTISSAVATVTVLSALSIVTQPVVKTNICSGSNATLNVVAAGGLGNYTYQWKSSSVLAGPFVNINGANSSSYTTPNLGQTTYYQVVVSESTQGCNPVTSGVAIVIIPSIITQPVTPPTVCVGGTISVSALASANNGSASFAYQWQNSPDGITSWTNVIDGVGGTSSSYTSKALNTTTYFRCVITSSNPNCTLVTSFVKATVIPDPTITTQPVGGNICEGGTFSLTSGAANGSGNFTYQWQKSLDGTTSWANVTDGSGANTTAYTTGSLSSDTFYRLRVTDSEIGCGVVNSNPARIDVFESPLISIQPTDGEVCINETHTFGVVASGNIPASDLLYQWQTATALAGPYSNVTVGNGGTTALYTTPTYATAGNQYFRVLISQSQSGCQTISNNVTLNVFGVPLAPTGDVTQQPSCDNTSGTVSITNPDLGTGYEYSKDGIVFQASNVFSDLPSGPVQIYVRRIGLSTCISPAKTFTIFNRICAVAENFAPISGDLGGNTGTHTILDSDLLNGVKLNPADITLTVDSISPYLIFDASTNTISVAPGTPADNYTLIYTICENANPSNCSTVIETISVTTAGINAVIDIVPVILNGSVEHLSVINVLTNDTLASLPATTSTVQISVVSAALPIDNNVPLVPVLNTNTGDVDVPAGTVRGLYVIEYKICELAALGNCDTARVLIPVGAAPINAQDDIAENINGHIGQMNVVNAFNNDSLNGIPITTANLDRITVTQNTAATPSYPGANVPVFSTATGNVTVPAGTPADTYYITYTICEKLNPTNCSDASIAIVVDPAPIVANDDVVNNVNGYDGAVNVINAYTNTAGADSFDGEIININLAGVLTAFILKQATPAFPGAPVPELLTSSGRVNVPSGTPAGQYQIKYQICEKLNPGNCDDAIITVNVIAPQIEANDDTVLNVNGYEGANDVINAYDNDLLNGGALDLVDITTTIVSYPSAINGGPIPIFDSSTGLVSIPPRTPAGEYKFVYKICENLNPNNCDEAVITITVIPGLIDALNDANFTPINGFVGNPNALNALDNDTLNGSPVIFSEVTITNIIPAVPINGGLVPVLNGQTGIVSVPAGTPAGIYLIVYQLNEKLNLSNNDTAFITIEVSAPIIEANDDAVANINGYLTTTNAINVVANDNLNGVTTNLSKVDITVDIPAVPINSGPVPVLEPLTGFVSIPAGTPAGDYEIKYHICEKLNPTNCNDATVFINVIGAPILAVNDSANNINGFDGATNVVNAITNDLLNGTAVQLSEINIISINTILPSDYVTGNPVPTLNIVTGSVDVPSGTSAGKYTIHYKICEKLNAANCSEADIEIVVVAAKIIANDDVEVDVNGYVGSVNVLNVLDNDSFNNSSIVAKKTKATAINISQITITILAPASPINGNPKVAVLDPSKGIVSVPAGTPAGLYRIQYRISENLNPSNFDDAIVLITVIATTIDANNDAALNVNGFKGQADVVNAIANDNLNGVAVQLSEIKIGVIIPATSINAGPVPALDIVSGKVSVPAGTPSGIYTIRYEICEVLNPTNCSQADIVVTVVSGPIIANDDAATGINGLDGAINVVNVLTNDLLDNLPPTLSQVKITVVSPADVINSTAVPILDPLTGLVSVPAGTSTGNYTIVYQICENLNATNCDQAVVKITVSQPSITLIKQGVFIDTNGDGYAQPGELIRYSFRITNTGTMNLNNVTVTDPKAIISGSPISLAVGEFSVTSYTGIYVLTQSDINLGFVVNQALVTAQPLVGSRIQNLSDSNDPTLTGSNDPTVTPVTQFKDLTLIKGGQLTGNGGVGSVINYNFTVKNTGNVVLSNLEITDPMLTATSITVTPSVLAPGAIGTATASYTVKEADVANGEVVNTALVIGDDPQGNPVTDISDSTDPTLTGDDDPTVIDLAVQPSVAIVKTAIFNDENKNGYAEIGETVTYHFSVTNTGNILLVNVAVKDSKPGITINGGPIILKQGETNTENFVGTYVLTASDIALGQVENQAEVNAVSPDGIAVTDKSDDNSVLEDDPTILPLNSCKVTIYNAVSPNGDGVNDIFKIDGIRCYPDAYVEIYDRWGVLVYDAYNYDNESVAFRGISEGRATVKKQDGLPDGTYFYVITYKTYLNEPISLTGYLYLSK
ncbi:gliding motility-associated C-terminal domain-containing protein [Flavobacterium sp. FlaQc-57]|uniref:DUF7507 domain-containing protein n=1 Tax=Flavobacterium sp. FlaQc-57 TaxID=3374186 RepID=UPI003756FCDD